MKRESEAAREVTRGGLVEILKERFRQDDKWGEQNHTPERWLAILGEEHGELCEAVLETIFDNGKEARKKGGRKNICREAIQVAAVALAIWECEKRRVAWL